jgi:tryptophan 2,3-dioxygenase
MELLLGLGPTERRRLGHSADPIAEIETAAPGSPGGDAIVRELARTRNEPSLRDALLTWLRRTPIQGSSPGDTVDDAAVADFLAAYRTGVQRYDERLLEEFDRFVQPADQRRHRAGLLFIESYRDLPLLSWPYVLIETVVEMEELLVLWRTRHARMVERMIGRRSGTGGSPGVAYLDATTQYRIFHEFWTVRTLLLPREFLPALRQRELYELAVSAPDATP